MKTVVFGQGYVGLPLAARAYEVGDHVVGVETDRRRATALAAGRSYVADVSPEVVAGMIRSGRYTPTSDASLAAGFDAALITVPTPLKDGAPDLSFIESAARNVGPWIRPGSLVILESTTYPGTTENVLLPLLEERSGLSASRDFFVGFSPERIDPGNEEYGLVNTPKLVSGVGDRACEAAEAFYSRLVNDVVSLSSTRAAEMAKLLENTYRHVNIALVNEFALISRGLGVDIWEAIEAAATKPFGYSPFYPGPGVGGHCLPVDPAYLAWEVKRSTGQHFRFVELAMDVNDHMPRYVATRIGEALNSQGVATSRSKVLIIGVAYKPNTSDTRESPAGEIIRLLRDQGAQVEYSDPFVPQYMGLASVHLDVARLDAADCVAIITDHGGVDYASVERSSSYVLDCRNRLGGRRDRL